MEEATIERLDRSAEREVLDVFTQAFEGHPFIPAVGARPKNTKALMKAFIDFFAKTKNSLLLGIRKDDRLVCASLSVDSTEQPSTLTLIWFIVALSRAMGWRSAKELETVHKEEPKYEGRYLELVILGTLPEYQRQGFGRRILRFLCDEAKRRECKGVILVADRDTPACRFYVKEGFKVDKEFATGETTLCWMRYVTED
jgi:ribosomal protein S18 acetylase RimI-like enzyme